MHWVPSWRVWGGTGAAKHCLLPPEPAPEQLSVACLSQSPPAGKNPNREEEEEEELCFSASAAQLSQDKGNTSNV